jgi:ABC-2 type transport system ATP-binding protein
MSSLISVNNLTRRYGDFCAVNNISFELATGDILGFLGPNGAGKSTTMQMLTGNLAPGCGEIKINGIDLLENPKAAKEALGYLPETPPLYQEMTVSEYLEYCARLHRVSRQQLRSVCDMAVESCGLGEVRHRLIRNLSKGYQQRVGIAQAILHSPPVIILDEPTVGLDPIQIMEIRSLIKNLGESHGIILCSHILPEVQAVCNRVQIINQGKLVYSADLDKMISRKQNSYDVLVSTRLSQQELKSHDVFTSVEKTGECRFTVESELNSDKLAEYIAQQNWGLQHFTPQQTTLEQIFVDLTLADSELADTSNPKDRQTGTASQAA